MLFRSVYFYKYREKKDDKWRIAISGLQPADSLVFSFKNLYTKFTDEKIKDDEPLDEQLAFQLKKIIFANSTPTPINVAAFDPKAFATASIPG